MKKIILDKPRVVVDFNELLERDLVLLSRSDSKKDSSGTIVQLYSGLAISIYSYDNVDDDGRIDPMIADGVVESVEESQNKFWREVKWRCRIDDSDIRFMSEEYPELQEKMPIADDYFDGL